MSEDEIREIVRDELASEQREHFNVRDVIHDELEHLIKTDRITFQRALQILDGRHISVGGNIGTKIGTASDQKLGFFGVTPVVQQNDPSVVMISTVSGTGDDGTINSNFADLENTVSNLRDIVRALGLAN